MITVLASGSTSANDQTEHAANFQSGPRNLLCCAFGDWTGGGSVSLEVTVDDGTTWVIVDDLAGAACTFSAAGSANIHLAADVTLRCTVSGTVAGVGVVLI
jgi:hypothetical protein